MGNQELPESSDPAEAAAAVAVALAPAAIMMTWQKMSASRGMLDGLEWSRRDTGTRSEAAASSGSARSLPNRVSPEALGCLEHAEGRRLRHSR